MKLVYNKVHAPDFPSGLSSPSHLPSSPLDNGTWKTFGRKKRKRDKGGIGSSLAEAIIDITIDTAIDMTISST